MKRITAAVLAACVPATAGAADIKDTSYRDAEGRRVQQLELVVHAPVGRVWQAFTTDKGFMSWGAPVARVTPGNGGMIEASYSLSAKIGDPENIKNRIVLYVPEQELVLHNEHVPKSAPFKTEVIDKIRTVIRFEDLGGGRTKVVESGVGYGEGADFDAMYALFASGNREEFSALARSLEEGPVDWKAQAAAANASVGAK